jgi:hypothetical protein
VSKGFTLEPYAQRDVPWSVRQQLDVSGFDVDVAFFENVFIDDIPELSR